MLDVPRREKKGRNGYGNGSQDLHVTLPLMSYEIVARFAKQRNVGVARMMHDIIVDWYHYQKGTHIDYEDRPT